MKRLLAISLVLSIAIGGIFLAQRRRHIDAVNPNAILDAAADIQRDLSRVPMHMSRLSDESEIRIGNELADQYLHAEPEHSNDLQTVEKYVGEVGARNAAHAHRKIPYCFHLIANPDFINAFALPGGHIFVGLGLLKQMTSEDELADVLGHEIEHVDHYHAAERVQIEAHLRKLDLEGLAGLALIPLEIWQAGYSKDQELEADREGLRLAVAARYSAQGALNLFERWSELHREFVIRANTPVDELSQVAIEGLQGYFRSHPLPEERLEQAKRVISEDGFDATKPLTPLVQSDLLRNRTMNAENVKDSRSNRLGH
jgi:beta-barrel assembly-enhancing protease